MAKEKAKDEELSATGKQTVAHAYSAMDYYFDHLKKTVSSAPSGGTEFGERVVSLLDTTLWTSSPETSARHIPTSSIRLMVSHNMRSHSPSSHPIYPDSTPWAKELPSPTSHSNRSLRTEVSVAGKRNFQARRQRGRNGLGDSRTPVQRQNPLGNSANSGLIAGFREISVRTRMRGGAGRLEPTNKRLWACLSADALSADFSYQIASSAPRAPDNAGSIHRSNWPCDP